MFNGAAASSGVGMFENIQTNVRKFNFIKILLEAILIGLAFALSTVWSSVILESVDFWLDDWNTPLQRLISALFITAACIIAAFISVVAAYFSIEERANEITERAKRTVPIPRKRVRPTISPDSSPTRSSVRFPPSRA